MKRENMGKKSAWQSYTINYHYSVEKLEKAKQNVLRILSWRGEVESMVVVYEGGFAAVRKETLVLTK